MRPQFLQKYKIFIPSTCFLSCVLQLSHIHCSFCIFTFPHYAKTIIESILAVPFLVQYLHILQYWKFSLSYKDLDLHLGHLSNICISANSPSDKSLIKKANSLMLPNFPIKIKTFYFINRFLSHQKSGMSNL